MRTLRWLVILISASIVTAQPTTSPTRDAVHDEEFESAMRTMRYRFPLRIVGTVVDAESGEPVKSFYVIPCSTEQSAIDYDAAKQFSGGKYDWVNESAYPGRFIRIESDGYAPARSGTFEQHVVGTFDVKLHRAPNITGVVLSPQGQPAVGATIRVVPPPLWIWLDDGKFHKESVQRYMSQTDSLGRFSLRPQEAGMAVVTLHETGWSVIHPTADAREQQIKLLQWASVEGVARIGDRPAPAGEVIECRMAAAAENGTDVLMRSSSRTITDGDGRFRFDRVPAGRGQLYREIRLEGDAYTFIGHAASATIDATHGQTAQARLGGTGRAVIGRVNRDGGIPEGWLGHGSLYPASQPQAFSHPNNYTFRVARDGSFRIDDVSPGNYKLEIRFSEFTNPFAGRVSPRELTVADAPADDEPLELGEIEVKE